MFVAIVTVARIAVTLITELDLRDLLMLAATCRQLKTIALDVLDGNTLQILIRYFDKPAFMLYVLRSTRSVISGSVALRALFPGHPNMKSWASADIDIYVPKSQYTNMVISLYETDGYYEIGVKISDGGYSLPKIQKVVRLFNGRCNIDLVVSRTESCSDNIFGFHSTVVMNFISGYGIFCAYPTFTLEHRGYINPKFMQEDEIEYPSIEKCIQKYERRGFTISALFRATHSFGFSNRCPHTLRSLYDGYSLFIPFNKSIGSQDDDEPLDSRYIYDRRHDTIWSLGGPLCYGRRPEGGKRGFVMGVRLNAW
jgi:hypothetical protein